MVKASEVIIGLGTAYVLTRKKKEDPTDPPVIPPVEPPIEPPVDTSPLDVSISVNNVIGETPLSVGFELRTNGKRPLKKVVWNFGDGSESRFVNPNHIFQTGQDQQIFFVSVMVLDADDRQGAGKINITVIQPIVLDETPIISVTPEVTVEQTFLAQTQFATTPTSITVDVAEEIQQTRILSDSEVISLALQKQIPVFEGGFTVSVLREMLGIS